MALQFQDLPIPLVAGQNAGSDAALISPPEFLKVTNGEFADRGNIRVVDGLTGLAITTMAGETAPDDTNPTLRRLLTHKDELLLETYKGIFRQQVGGSFALAASVANRKRENLRVMRMGVTSLTDAQGSQSDDWNQNRRPNAGVLGMDAAQLGDYTCTVWCEQYGTAGTSLQVSWQIRHKTSDAVVGRGRIRDSAGTVKEPRVVAFGGQFRIYAIGVGGASNVGYKFIDPASTQNVTETLTAYGGLAAGPYSWLDVALSPATVGLVATRSGAAVVDYSISTQAAPAAVLFANSVATAGVCGHVGLTYIDTGGLGVNQAFIAFYACAGSLTTARWSGLSAAGAVIAEAVQLLGSVPGRFAPFKQYTGSAANWPVLIDGFDGTLATTSNNQVQVIRYDGTTGASGALASAGAVTALVDGAILAGQPVSMRAGVEYDGTGAQGLLLPVQFADSTQSVFAVLDVTQALTAALGGGASTNSFPVLRVFDAGSFYATHFVVGGGVFAVGRIGTPAISPGSGGLAVHVWCAKFTPNITNVTDLGQNPTNIQRNTLAYDDKLGSIEFSDVTYMAGGCPLVYDGQDIFEEGFAAAPQVFNVTIGAGAGPLAVGSYSIVFVYEWFDGQGNRWQSQVSRPTSFTTTPGNQIYTAGVRACPFTLKSGVQVIPYRTAASGTVYYRDSPLGVTPLSDAAITSSELLYAGPGSTLFLGTQSNNALPGVKNFTEHQNRLVAVGGEFERGFFYSKERSLRFPGEFNRASGFGLVPEVTKRLAAGSSIDDKLVLFAENGISVVFGQGPNLNWLQNGYTAPVRIQAAEGIRFDSPFIAEVDDGVWYVTGVGPRLLTRGLATAKGSSGNPLGDELRSGGQALIGACEAVLVHPVKPQVLFRSNTDNLTYVYDYQRNKWTQRNDFGSTLSMVSARGLLHLIRPELLASTPLRYESPNSTVRNTLSLETGWVSFAGIQRFQRFSHLQMLGCDGPKVDFTTNYDLRLRVYGKEQPLTLVQDTTLSIASNLASNTPWQAAFQLVKQTDTAYRLLLDVTPDDSGGNFSITGLLATVGLKRGGAKLPNAQRG